MKKPLKQLALESFVAISLCVSFFFFMLPVVMAPRYYDNNSTNAYLFTHISKYPVQTKEDYENEFPVFAARMGPRLLTGALWNCMVDLTIKNHGTGVYTWNGYNFNLLSIAFGTYQAGWLALLFGLLIRYRPDAVLIMLGTFSGLMYNFNIPAGSWCYPWDMPSLALFTWAILISKEYYPLIAVAFAASLIKETGATCALLVLLGPWSWRKRIGGFVGLILAFVISRKLLMACGNVQTIFLPFAESTSFFSFIGNSFKLFLDNMKALFSFHLNSPFFSNCGMLFVMFFLPARKQIKLTAAAFFVGQLMFGIIFEFRIWYELLPLGMMQLSDYLKTCLPTPAKQKT